MKTFWGIGYKNFGDTLTPIILEHFTDHKAEYVEGTFEGKLIMTGSLLHEIKAGDTILGTGHNRPNLVLDNPPDTRFLAIRGPLSRSYVKNAVIPEVYGDPALLLPLMYQPEVKKKHKVGWLPHYIEKPFLWIPPRVKVIDVEKPWQKVVRDILSCDIVVSSSLHGVIVAEAYGVPVVWATWSKLVEGGNFKFQDYFMGTGRSAQTPFTILPPIENLDKIQDGLINALKEL